MVKAITFDVWYTILDDRRLKAERKCFRLNAIKDITRGRYSLNEIETVFKKERENYLEAWRIQKALTVKERASYILKELRLEATQDEINLLAHKLNSAMFKYPPDLIEGAYDFISWAKDHFILGLICDVGMHSGDTVAQLLNEFGIGNYFKCMVFSDQLGITKPSVVPFNTAFEKMNLTSNQVIHIGDRENTDIEGAKRVGASAVLFLGAGLSSENESKADYIVYRFDELRDIFDGFGRAYNVTKT